MTGVIESKNAGLIFANKELGMNARIISIDKIGKNWRELVEVIEEKNAIENVIGVYELITNDNLEVISYNRKGLRKSGDTSPKSWEQSP